MFTVYRRISLMNLQTVFVIFQEKDNILCQPDLAIAHEVEKFQYLHTFRQKNSWP